MSGLGPTLHTTERAVLLALLALGVLAAGAALRLGLWEAEGPGSGGLPGLAGLLVALCAALSLARPEGLGSGRLLPDRGALWRVTGVLLGIALLAALAPVLGFLVTAVPVMTALLLLSGGGNWLGALLLAAATSLALHQAFERGLDTLLPRGLLGLA